MQIIHKREKVHVEQYELSFEWRDQPGAGYGFPCDKQGNIEWNWLPLAAVENLIACQQGKYDVVPQGVRDCSYDYWKPAVGRCSTCGKEVMLYDAFTNECEYCGALYNGFGQDLAPRSQWDPRGEY